MYVDFQFNVFQVETSRQTFLKSDISNIDDLSVISLPPLYKPDLEGEWVTLGDDVINMLEAKHLFSNTWFLYQRSCIDIFVTVLQVH